MGDHQKQQAYSLFTELTGYEERGGRHTAE